LAKRPTNCRSNEIIGRNFNDAEKSEQCSLLKGNTEVDRE